MNDRKPTTRETAGRIAEALFSNNDGDMADTAVMMAPDGRQVAAWTRGTIAHFIAMIIERTKGVPSAA